MTIHGADARVAPGVPVVGVAGDGHVALRHADAWRELGASAVTAAETSWEHLVDHCTIIDVSATDDPSGDLASQAIAAGRHVICAPTTEARTAIRLADAAALADVQLLPGYLSRFAPGPEALHAAVAAGRLGTIAFARFTRAGGAAHDLINDIDQALWIAGPVSRVLARQAVSPTASSTLLVLSHEGGAVSHVVGIPGGARMAARIASRVTGTNGAVAHDSATASSLRLGGIPLESSTDVDEASALSAALAEFLRAITTGEPPRVDAADGVAASAVAEAARESIATGRAVPIAVVMERAHAKAAS